MSGPSISLKSASKPNPFQDLPQKDSRGRTIALFITNLTTRKWKSQISVFLFAILTLTNFCCRIYIFGGGSSNRVRFNDTLKLTLDFQQQDMIVDGPLQLGSNGSQNALVQQQAMQN
jgi:hypothetical protein